MKKRVIILISIIIGILLLSFVLVFLRHKFEEVQDQLVEFIFPKEDYAFSLIISILLLIIPSFILGFIGWLVFRKKQFDKIFYFLIFNLAALIFLISADSNEIYKIWHYNKYQANIDYNASLTKRNGGYLDSCLIMVQDDLLSHGLLPNDYRILSYSYDETLTTIPRDTTKQFYSFEVLYSKNDNGVKTLREVGYLVNFDGKIKEIYDVDPKDKRAEEQIESLRKNLKYLNTKSYQSE